MKKNNPFYRAFSGIISQMTHLFSKVFGRKKPKESKSPASLDLGLGEDANEVSDLPNPYLVGAIAGFGTAIVLDLLGLLHYGATDNVGEDAKNKGYKSLQQPQVFFLPLCTIPENINRAASNPINTKYKTPLIGGVSLDSNGVVIDVVLFEK
jgi:hypothetical protein